MQCTLRFFRGVDDLRRDAAEIHLVGLQHADRDARRDARIDRVAAGFEDLETGVRREIVSRGNDVPRAHDGHAFYCGGGRLCGGGFLAVLGKG